MYFADINDTSGLPEALKFHHAYWAQYIVSVGAVAGMSTVSFRALKYPGLVSIIMYIDGERKCFTLCQ